jgi:hypothetical protein
VIDKVYASMLKLPVTTGAIKRDELIKTGLKYRFIPKHEAGWLEKKLGMNGVEDLELKIGSLNNDIDSIIGDATNLNKKISTADVVQRLDDLLAKGDDIRFVDPEYKKVIRRVRAAMLKQGNEMTPYEAQKSKQHIYKVYRDSYVNRANRGDAIIDAKQAQARGLKEELEYLDPRIKPYNAEEGALLNFLTPAERATLRIQNNNPLSLGSYQAVQAGRAALGPDIGPKVGLVAAGLQLPQNSARLAILLDALKKSPVSRGRAQIGKASPFGMVAYKNAIDDALFTTEDQQ